MIYTVQITQQDIDCGRRRSVRNCPIAKAVSRLIGKQVGVGDEVFDWNDFNDAARLLSLADLPAQAVVFRDRFDSGEAVQPMSFDLEIAP